MTIKQMYRDDLLNRFASHTFTETVAGSTTLVEFKDAGDAVIGAAQNLVVDDAYRNIRRDLVGLGEVIITVDEDQRDTWTSSVIGTLIYNTDGGVEVFNGSDWDPA